MDVMSEDVSGQGFVNDINDLRVNIKMSGFPLSARTVPRQCVTRRISKIQIGLNHNLISHT